VVPALQVQVKLPGVLVQTASAWQSWVPAVHSSMSVQGSPPNPASHVQSKLPGVLLQVALAWQSWVPACQ
jgi:hypothetical protein